MTVIELPIGAMFYDFEFDTNTMDGEENASVPQSPTHVANAKANINNTNVGTSHQGPSDSASTKKTKRRLSFSQDGGSYEFTNTISLIKAWMESFEEHISRLANCFQFLSDEAKMKKKVFIEILKIEGLLVEEKIRVSGLIVTKTNKVSYFFSLPHEYKK